MTRGSGAGRMAGRTAGMLAATLAAGLVFSLGSTALAAPIGMLKQFKVPTANSQPRSITNGSDGNRWFTEGTDSTLAPAKIARITSSGAITEFAPAPVMAATLASSATLPRARTAFSISRPMTQP